MEMDPKLARLHEALLAAMDREGRPTASEWHQISDRLGEIEASVYDQSIGEELHHLVESLPAGAVDIEADLLHLVDGQGEVDRSGADSSPWIGGRRGTSDDARDRPRIGRFLETLAEMAARRRAEPRRPGWGGGAADDAALVTERRRRINSALRSAWKGTRGAEPARIKPKVLVLADDGVTQGRISEKTGSDHSTSNGGPAVMVESESIDTSYEPFSREPEYIELNRGFIRDLDLGQGLAILDLACGTCVLTRLIMEEVGESAEVTGLDLSRESLEIAREDLDLRNPASPLASRVGLLQGTGDALPVRSRAFDLVVIGNAIHCFDDLDVFFGEVTRVLRDGGCFAFNSSFYAGTFVPGTERFYDEWMKQAVKFVLARDAELRRQGKPGIRRKRGTVSAAFSRPWLSPDEYRQVMERHGLRVTRTNQRTVVMTQRSFETVGAYEGLASVLLSGYPVKLASEALMHSVRPALESVGLKEVPRHWLEMAAVKDPRPA
jgi:ubiquinone/menaquinone biosynthesis C-methylase UbiE